MQSPIINVVTAYIDWNSQIHAAKPPRNSPAQQIDHTIKYIGRVIGRSLNVMDPDSRYVVTLRFYYGWRKGFESTLNRKSFITAVSAIDFSSLSTRSNVVIRPEIGYGDRLVYGLDKRLHPKLGIHFPDTYRFDSKIRRFGEKMVDTAIASDMVDVAHREPNTWLLVLAGDDDFVPPLLAAEAARDGRSGRVALVRERDGGPFFKLDGLRVWP